MKYETVIGLEIHVELSTASKIFCGCSTKFGGEINTHCCPVCMGFPGSLPVLNEKVVELAVKAGLCLNCEIKNISKMDRKNYFYPDLPKAYQISQFYMPICENGYLDIEIKGNKKRIGINRIHIEEDAGKLLHEESETESIIDYNRCGIPLIEIVSEPDINSKEEALEYLEKIRLILLHAGISDCKMQEGSFRVDINISVRKRDEKKLGVRTEIKNLNSFRAVSKVIEIEVKRQIELIESDRKVLRETRRYDDFLEETFVMRIKEKENDYRFFAEPDLSPIIVSDKKIDEYRNSLPELYIERLDRYVNKLGIPIHEAELISSSVMFSDFFDKTVEVGVDAKHTLNWVTGDLMKLMKSREVIPITPNMLAELINLIDDEKISNNIAKKVFENMFETLRMPSEIICSEKFELITDSNDIEKVINRVLDENNKAVSDYLNGKEKAFGFLIGKVMKITNQNAEPKLVNKIMRDRLESLR